jgi:hypothetical protein
LCWDVGPGYGAGCGQHGQDTHSQTDADQLPPIQSWGQKQSHQHIYCNTERKLGATDLSKPAGGMCKENKGQKSRRKCNLASIYYLLLEIFSLSLRHFEEG